MRKILTWLNEYLRWKMFQWIWGFDNKQTSHIRKRIEDDEHKMEERMIGKYHEVTMDIPNFL